MNVGDATAERDEVVIRELYRSILDGWNSADGEAFAAPFAEDGEAIGYDGSVHSGRSGIAADLNQIFAHHTTATYVARVKGVRLLGNDAGVLRAIAGLVPPGQSDLAPGLNAHQTVVAARLDGRWRVVLLQNTPARFDGRPELAERMTEELREELRTSGAAPDRG
jgi:uncharacterized protein (TIGR02246 family)